ncbi:DUF3883 domain-containing protein [Clostridium estertheticum]|nr:DUF3883 domain-containing protein [Clostridium estertheticum]MCB2351727.1 DUF3883 domain-containing protein [Clostridium estertheticum]
MKNGMLLKKQLNIEIDEVKLDEALKHSSYIFTHESSENIEVIKIESTLGRKLVDVIYFTYNYIEGNADIMALKGKLNKEKIAAIIHKRYNLKDLYYLSVGEAKSNNDKVYSDVVYRIIYTLYVFKGFNYVYEIIKSVLEKYEGDENYKGLLQEYTQKKGVTPKYLVIKEEGLPNEKIYTVKLTVLNQEIFSSANKKQNAEQGAAREFLKQNNISCKKKINKGGIRYDKLNSERLKDIENIKEINGFKYINLITNDLINISFTHKSYTNKGKYEDKRSDKWNYNSSLCSIGTEVFDFYTGKIIYNQLCEQNKAITFKEFFMNLKAVTQVNELNLRLITYLGSSLKYFTILNMVNKGGINEYAFQVYKALLGATVIDSYYMKNSSIETMENIIQENIQDIVSCENKTDMIDYYSWLESFTDMLEVEHKINITGTGKNNERIYQATLSVNLNQYNSLNFNCSSKGESKKDVRHSLAKQFYYYLNNKLDITSKYNNDKTRNILLREVINKVIKTNGFYKENCNLLGGLCFDEISIIYINNIVKNLIDVDLYTELKVILSKLKYANKDIISEIIKKYKLDFLFEGNDRKKSNEIHKIRNYDMRILSHDNFKPIKNKKNIVQAKINNISVEKFFNKNINEILLDKYEIEKGRFEKIKDEKDGIVFTKMYLFENENCPYCNSKLNDVVTLINCRYNKKNITIEDEIKSCSFCGIRGVNKTKYNVITEMGFKLEIYNGTPPFYASTIINKRYVDIIISFKEEKDQIKDKKEKIKDKKEKVKDKKITICELYKQQQLKNKIGDDGEKFVLDYEKNYLKSIGKDELAEKVEQISLTDCSAGYDIISFTEEGVEKHIEVKTSTVQLNSFYISTNELHSAEKQGDHYFLYKVNNIYSEPYINVIKDPFSLIKQEKMSLKPVSYLVNFKY